MATIELKTIDPTPIQTGTVILTAAPSVATQIDALMIVNNSESAATVRVYIAPDGADASDLDNRIALKTVSAGSSVRVGEGLRMSEGARLIASSTVAGAIAVLAYSEISQELAAPNAAILSSGGL